MTTIACADDDRYFLTLYQRIFSNRGYNVCTYESGEAVLESLKNDCPDAFVLDIDMPTVSGLEVCRKLRRNPDFCKAPIIIVSAYDTEDDIVSALSAGADDYIIKPIRAAELLAKVTAVLNKKDKPVPVNDFAIPVGSLFAGRYEVIEKVGSGGFSQVYHARNTLRTPVEHVALKVFEITPSRRNDKESMSRFLREAYGLSKVDHPNIVELNDFGSSELHYYLSMEYLIGRTLSSIIAKNGCMPEDSVVMIGYELIKALQYLEKRQLVHRDIKPNNVMVVDTGDVKLIDFGLAKQNQEETVSLDELFTGTPQYAAPESIRMEPDVDTKADIFSLGATLYFLLCGEEPFPDYSPVAVFNRRYEGKLEIRPVLEVNKLVSHKFAGIINRMIADEKDERPSIDELDLCFAKLISTA